MNQPVGSDGGMNITINNVGTLSILMALYVILLRIILNIN